MPRLYNCCLWALYKMDLCHKSKGCKFLLFLIASILQKTITITRVRFHMHLLNIVLSGRRKHKKIPLEAKKNQNTSTLVYAHMAICGLLSPGVYTKHHNAALYTVTRGNFKLIIGAAAPCFFFFLLPVHLIYHRTGSWQQNLLSPGGRRGGPRNINLTSTLI